MIEFHCNIEKFNRIMGVGWYEYVINKNFDLIKNYNRKRNKKVKMYYKFEVIKLYNVKDIKYKIVPDIKNYYILGLKEKNSNFYPNELEKDLQIMHDFYTNFYYNMLERYINRFVLLDINYCDKFKTCITYNRCVKEEPRISDLEDILTLNYEYDYDEPYIKNYTQLCNNISEYDEEYRDRLEELYLNCYKNYYKKCNGMLCMKCLTCRYCFIGYGMTDADLKTPLII